MEEIKCDSCCNLRYYYDEVYGGDEYCSEGHWEGRNIPEKLEHVDDYFKDCKDYIILKRVLKEKRLEKLNKLDEIIPD